jgi:hypothetical protein
MGSISTLNGADWAQMREHIATVQAAIKKRYNAGPLDKSARDLDHLQRLIDDNVYDETQQEEFKAIGTAFGNVLERQLGLEWVAEEDNRGDREPALRLKAARSFTVSPQRMIWMRASKGHGVNLAELFRAVKDDAANAKLI